MDERMISEFVTFLVVLDPLGMVPIFWAITHQVAPVHRRHIAVQGVFTATLILIAFAFVGRGFMELFGITLPAFQIAGGILLFLLSMDMIFARQSGLRSTTDSEQEEALHKSDVAIFPLAFPLIAGPGAMTTVLLFSDRSEGTLRFIGTIGIMLFVLGLVLLCLLAANRIMRRMGETGTNAVSRLLGLILAALSVQYVVDGIHGSFAVAGG
ncbi:MAG: MarC family protein [Nitrospirota bacterium]|nr:MarC family protein [Nitrospirota bacterium]